MHAQRPSGQAREPAASSDKDIASVRRLLDRGKALARAGKLDQAETPLQLAIQGASALTPPNASLLSEALAELASCLVQRKQPAEAQPLIQRALPLVARDTLDGAKREFQLQMTLAESYRYQLRNEFAVAPFRAAIAAAARPQFEADMMDRFIDASTRLASTLSALDRHVEATETLEQALQATQSSARAADSYRLSVLLAASQMRAGRVSEALTLLRSVGAKGHGLRRSDETFYDVPIEEFMPESGAPRSDRAAAPPAAAMPSQPPTNTPAVSSAALRVAEMRDGFQRCYVSTLAADRGVEGSARIVMKVGADGGVTESKALGVGLPVEMVECILRRAMTGGFDPPAGGSAVIVVPVTFVKR
jgi:hypothetical protein